MKNKMRPEHDIQIRLGPYSNVNDARDDKWSIWTALPIRKCVSKRDRDRERKAMKKTTKSTRMWLKPKCTAEMSMATCNIYSPWFTAFAESGTHARAMEWASAFAEWHLRVLEMCSRWSMCAGDVGCLVVVLQDHKGLDFKSFTRIHLECLKSTKSPIRSQHSSHANF